VSASPAKNRQQRIVGARQNLDDELRAGQPTDGLDFVLRPGVNRRVSGDGLRIAVSLLSLGVGKYRIEPAVHAVVIDRLVAAQTADWHDQVGIAQGAAQIDRPPLGRGSQVAKLPALVGLMRLEFDGRQIGRQQVTRIGSAGHDVGLRAQDGDTPGRSSRLTKVIGQRRHDFGRAGQTGLQCQNDLVARNSGLR
jgi:hypothetical protein